MQEVQKIQIADFDYPLSDERIAKYPLAERDLSKLLVAKNSEISHTEFKQLPGLLPKNSLLVFNNTKVIHARMQFYKSTGARIEIFCLEPILPADYNLMFQSTQQCEWKCIVGNAKKWKEGKLELKVPNFDFLVKAEKVKNLGEGSFQIRFSWENSAVNFSQIIEEVGNIPIPPYLNRNTEEVDQTRYQTVYSKNKGSVAAPTAGLHFTPAILQSIQNNESNLLELTLHVGAGTFKPVKSDEIGEHDMHTEHFSFTVEALQQMRMSIGEIVPVGTTSLRSVESIYWLGTKVIQNPNLPTNDLFVSQWEPYQEGNKPTPKEAIDALIDYCSSKKLSTLQARTQIMIVPGYTFRFISALITNFHQPKSTLLLLVGAILGPNWKEVYQYALQNDFRFLSYGDSSILFLNK